MDNQIDTLQIEINKAKGAMAPEAIKAISSLNWKAVILALREKMGYSQDQIETLETETELLLCGLINPANYPIELQNRMGVDERNVEMLISVINSDILEKIKDQLIKNLNKKQPEMNIPQKTKGDEILSDMPEEFKQAITQSNWKEKLYNIGQKYKLTIEQLGYLEQITTKVIFGEIHTNQYEGELKSKIPISNHLITDLVQDINEDILKSIREIIKKNYETNEALENAKDDDLPIPPYQKVDNGEFKIKQDNNNPQNGYAKAGVEIIKDELEQKKDIINNNTDDNVLKNSGINIIEDKLTNPTVSNKIATDYSLPKINKQIPQTPFGDNDGHLKHNDPYKEVL